MYFDTHVNLHGDAFSDDLDSVLERGRAASVTRLLSICDRIDNFERVLDIAKSSDTIWCSFGVHPHYAKDYLDLSAADFAGITDHAKVVAIGETGLDQHYAYSSIEDQERAFRVHIDVARATQLPIIIHTRNADELTAEILESEFEKGQFPILMHCYTGGANLARRAQALGAYFSVSGILSFKSASEVREVIANIPTDRVILETDCPYLAPVPMRGRRNEPAFLPHVAEAYGSLIGSSPDKVAHQTTENALRLFWKVT